MRGISLERFANAPVTLALIIINVVIFIAETLSGGSENTTVALKFGAQYTPRVREGQYYRIIMAMFLHFGFIHILCNMWALYNIGPTIERVFGSGRYIIIYLGAGICGNLLTYFVELRTGSYKISAGASGAVFGLMGAYLVLALMPRLRAYFSLSNILINIAINVIYGLRARGINMLAHLGGLAGGALISGIIILFLLT